MSAIDPRIGKLNSGQFYAFVNGYDNPEFRGTLEEVEAALGLRAHPVKVDRVDAGGFYMVTLRFQFPAWDEVDGIVYTDISARSKSDAIRIARESVRNDGHTGGGKGRYWFIAEEL